MPIFDYKCLGCGVKFEKMEKQNQEHRHKCPECGYSKTAKIITPGSVRNFRLKGEGWYRNDQ